MTIWAILPAAGIGRRMGSAVPKQYLPLNGVPVITHSLQRLHAVQSIQKIVVVLHPEDSRWAALAPDQNSRISCALGGDERYQSVLNGLEHLASEAADNDWVLVHDAVRPCVRTGDIEKLITELSGDAVGGLLGSPVDNTLKQVDDGLCITRTVDRRNLWNALTPQMFRYSILKDAINRVVFDGTQITDEASAVELLGHKPRIIEGSKDNIKITHADDLVLASKILESQAVNHEY
ncbi:MAG: 2-C-methyl-D-erythritol 4-phosphate cytidylyltransferase [SAR86 cluster bacterium]|uniref:2-C-methyl-D-erythritol 4-phosphate cytidylyltransferase n=1 Tax=SAR86 cluster bacterium TaxID=2030880 RepID=A0A2A5B558_9GAMM|nr:MAG: 2-C-methyl-D-erythritol 4-phosphate cytidylyltransferase [SAR86 cluster bacterium]